MKLRIAYRARYQKADYLDVGRIASRKQIKDLGDAVQDLLNAGDRTLTQASELMANLGQATEQLALGHTTRAIAKLEQFIDKVEHNQRKVILSPVQAAVLIAAAPMAVETINNGR